MQHGIFTLLVETLNSLIQVKNQSNKASPFDSHDVIKSALLVALFTYATASVAEVMLQARESPYCTLAGNLRLFAGALAVISLLAILAPVLGFITFAVWACLFMAVAYKSRTEIGNILGLVTHKLIDIFTRLAATVRTRKEPPNQQLFKLHSRDYPLNRSLISVHGVFALVVQALNSLLQVKFQTTKASPFDSHDVIMSVLLVALTTYATVSVAEAMLLARESSYCTLAGNLRLFAGALAVISLLAILAPVLGMAENHRPNPAFDKESVIMQHGIFTLLVETLDSLIQVKNQSNKASPFDGHDVIKSVLLFALFTYATASVAEVMLQARESPYCTLAGNLRLFAGALSVISLLSILAPVLGFITFAVWACLSMAVAYKSRTEIGNILGLVTHKLIDIFTRLAATVRTRKEPPNQPRV
ncbi:hypothetical protein SADUNF_Sadunf13G0026900 [Salix dunnii]|uniref:Uncharacterized protein n=1 Tax=Salix dunnii TaxID=1413687 RepID=A0A835JK33_9ROSI|nr:hypothetical protein SADUNF_Sadunf13G0026900 [Salix dunnii]